ADDGVHRHAREPAVHARGHSAERVSGAGSVLPVARLGGQAGQRDSVSADLRERDLWTGSVSRARSQSGRSGTAAEINPSSKLQVPSFEFGISREVAMRRMFIVVVAAATLFSIHAAAQQSTPDADSVIKAVTAAMGTARLRSVQYTGTGSINMTGQAYT